MIATTQPNPTPFYVEPKGYEGGPVHLFMGSDYYPMGGIGDYEGVFQDTQPDLPIISRYLQSLMDLRSKRANIGDHFEWAEALVTDSRGKLVCVARWGVEISREDFQECNTYTLKRNPIYMTGRGKYADKQG